MYISELARPCASCRRNPAPPKYDHEKQGGGSEGGSRLQRRIRSPWFMMFIITYRQCMIKKKAMLAKPFGVSGSDFRIFASHHLFMLAADKQPQHSAKVHPNILLRTRVRMTEPFRMSAFHLCSDTPFTSLSWPHDSRPFPCPWHIHIITGLETT